MRSRCRRAAIDSFRGALGELWSFSFPSAPLFLYFLNFPNRILYTFLMDPLRDLGRTLLYIGGLLVVLGALFYFSGKLPFRLGRLPGDIVHRGEHTTFYFPIVTCVVLS